MTFTLAAEAAARLMRCQLPSPVSFRSKRYADDSAVCSRTDRRCAAVMFGYFVRRRSSAFVAREVSVPSSCTLGNP